MQHCWNQRPNDRPSFTVLRNKLDEMIEAASTVEYISINVDESRDYYQLDEEIGSDQTTLLNTTTGDDIVFMEEDPRNANSSAKESTGDSAKSNVGLLEARKLWLGENHSTLLKLSGSSSGVSSMGMSIHSDSLLLPSTSSYLSSCEGSPTRNKDMETVFIVGSPEKGTAA